MTRRSTKSILVGMIGIDYNALRKTSGANVSRFVFAAICMLCIFSISAVSIYYAFDLMFHRWYVQILLSLFFSLMFGIIYILLIQTFSKQPLAQKTKYRLNTSNLLRGGFILFIGFLISKPVEILLLSGPLEKDIEHYRSQLTSSFEKHAHVLFAADIARLTEQFNYYRLADQVVADRIMTDITTLKEKEQTIIEKAHSRINSSSFFLQRVHHAVSSYLASWIICFFIVLLYFLPAALVYRVSSNNVYYIDKRQKEHALVVNHYLLFRQIYSKYFLTNMGLKNISFYESHTDPPFRTERIASPACDTEKEFFNRFRNYGLPQRLL